MHLPEGRPSEGTGHGSDRATGGAGFGPFWHSAKRWPAFSEAGGCSRTARRSQATVRSGPDLMGREFGLALGDFRKGPAARQGAGKPVSRFGGSSRRTPQSLLRFSERARTVSPFIRRAFRPWPSVADERKGRRKSVTRTREVEAVRVRKNRSACRLGAVVSLHIPPTGQDRALSAAQDFGVVSSFAGETDIVGQTSPQGAEAMRQW